MVKNVHEECDAPWQIVLVFVYWSGDWMELYMTTQQPYLSPYMFDFSDDFTVLGCGDMTNDFVVNTLWDKVYSSNQFIADTDVPI